METKIVARRALTPAPVPPSGLTLRSLAELGEERFSRHMLAAAEGDPFHTSTAASALDDLRELVEAAGPAFDSTAWHVVHDDAGEVGVLLPQVFPDDPTTGTVFYLGVLPARRGQGLGRALHRLGLAELARRGATRYVGSTGVENAPMVAVFRANGCDVEAVREDDGD